MTTDLTTATTMTSREIADLTGKQHSNVCRDIRAMLEQVYGNDDSDLNHEAIQGVIEERDDRGYIIVYHLDRDHTYTLLTGYDAKARLRVVRRWQELEVAAAKPALPDFTKPAEAARAWALEYERAEAEAAARQLAEAALEAAQPAVQFHDEVAFHEETEFLIRVAAKTLLSSERGAERRLVAWLLKQQWITKTGGAREATAHAVRSGFMRQRIDIVNGYPYQVAVITGKGMCALRLAIRTGELFTATLPRAALMLPTLPATH